MNKKPLFEDVDFADSVYRSCEMNDDILTVYLDSWDAKTLRIIFSHPIQFSYKLRDFVQGAFEVFDNPSLNEALLLKYVKLPENHPFKLFQILDISDFPIFEIVAEKATVIKE